MLAGTETLSRAKDFVIDKNYTHHNPIPQSFVLAIWKRVYYITAILEGDKARGGTRIFPTGAATRSPDRGNLIAGRIAKATLIGAQIMQKILGFF